MIVGVDAGTSGVKAVAFAPDGEVVAVESRSLALAHPGPGQVEQDAETVVAAVEEVLDRLVAGGVRADEVRAAGLTGQGDGLWLLDEQGRPAGPALSWLDGRATPLVDGWMRDGTFEELFRRTGNAAFPGAGAPCSPTSTAAAPRRWTGRPPPPAART
ncbi:FGGY family carbohydrate kinase [Streptosporangium lutulentum]